MNEHPPGCTCRPCLTGLGAWNLHVTEVRRRIRRRRMLTQQIQKGT